MRGIDEVDERVECRMSRMPSENAPAGGGGALEGYLEGGFPLKVDVKTARMAVPKPPPPAFPVPGKIVREANPSLKLNRISLAHHHSCRIVPPDRIVDN
jgi:hypothetical protein